MVTDTVYQGHEPLRACILRRGTTQAALATLAREVLATAGELAAAGPCGAGRSGTESRSSASTYHGFGGDAPVGARPDRLDGGSHARLTVRSMRSGANIWRA